LIGAREIINRSEEGGEIVIEGRGHLRVMGQKRRAGLYRTLIRKVGD
jgi:hypothetical protein